MTLGHELRSLDGMNSSRVWLTSKNTGRELRALDVMSNLVEMSKSSS